MASQTKNWISIGDMPLIFRPLRRFFTPGDVFFQEGNRRCFSESKHFVKNEDIAQLSARLSQFTFIEARSLSSVIACEVKGCKAAFSTTVAYELHLQASHWFSCKECRQTFPSNFLLDIHVIESHDNLFKAKREKGEAVFACLVESCCTKFSHEGDRKQHLLQSHNYPASFRFNIGRKNPWKSVGTDDNSYSIHTMVVEESDNSEAQECTKYKMKATDSKRRDITSVSIPNAISFGRGSSKTFHRRGQQSA